MTATEFTGAIIVPLKNEYGRRYGWEAICFPSSGGDWLDCALAGAIDRVIIEKWHAVKFALTVDIRSSWDGWDTDISDVWDQRRTTVASSLEKAIRIAALYKGYRVAEEEVSS